MVETTASDSIWNVIDVWEVEDDSLEIGELRKRFIELLPVLKDNEIQVLLYRMRGLTLGQVGKAIGVTRERIRQLEQGRSISSRKR